MAAYGYPLQPRKGDVIDGLPLQTEDCMVFHAGTTTRVNQTVETVTAGGRVLCVTALGSTVKAAQQRAYDMAKGINFDGAQMRHDIGYRAIKS